MIQSVHRDTFKHDTFLLSSRSVFLMKTNLTWFYALDGFMIHDVEPSGTYLDGSKLSILYSRLLFRMEHRRRYTHTSRFILQGRNTGYLQTYTQTTKHLCFQWNRYDMIDQRASEQKNGDLVLFLTVRDMYLSQSRKGELDSLPRNKRTMKKIRKKSSKII